MVLASTLLYLVIALVSLAIYYYKRHMSYFVLRGIPHDKPVFLYGNFNGFGKTRHLQTILYDYYLKYKGTGPFVGLYSFFNPSALILDLNLARNILIKDFNNFADRGVFHNEVDDPLTGHLFAIEGEKWKRLRSKLTPTFTSGKMKFMFPTILGVADQLLSTFQSMSDKDSIIEVKDLVSRFTTDVIGTCAFGLECNSLKDPDAEFRTMGKKFFILKRHGKFVDFLILSFPKLARKLRFRRMHDEIHNFYMRVVRETVELREKNSIKRKDFMDLLINLMSGDTGLTIEEVAAQAFVFFIAGFETSSTTMGYALFELALNQDIQDKLRAEVDEQFNENDGALVYESLAEMNYMDMVLKETLRKYSVAVTLTRECKNDYITSDPKYVLEKGMSILIPADAIHRDPEIYPDPEKFDPERFTPEEIQKRHPITWLPFGDGPRNCIGLRFGKMQVFVGLAYLIRNYKFYYSDQTPNPLEYDVKSPVLACKGGIYLRVEKIR